MTSAGTVTVDVLGRDVNLVALLARLEARIRETDQLGIKLSQTTGTTLAGAQLRAANSAISEAQAMARAAVAVGDNARAHNILVTALGNSAGASDKAVGGLVTQIGHLESGTNLATQFGTSLKSSLLGIIGPAALAGAAIAGVGAAIRSVEEGIRLKATLDANTTAIALQLRGVRDSNVAFQQANAYAQRYKLTQVELTEAMTAAMPVIRQSRAEMGTILGVFDQLRVRAPEKTFQDAARALGELQAGQYTSLQRIFNVPLADAKQLSDEIKKGGDAVQLLSAYLTRTGASMEVVAARADGAAGKIREMAQVSEQFSLAIGGAAGGPGLALLEARITATAGATRILTGDTQGMAQSFRQAIADGSGWLSILGALTGNSGFAAQQTREFAQASIAASAAQQQAAAASQQLAAAATAGALTMDVERQAVANEADAQAAATQLALIHGNAIRAVAEASLQHALVVEQEERATLLSASALQEAAIKADLNTVASQTLALADAQLMQQAMNAANALYAAGAAGAATAAQLANSSNGVDILTAAFYRLAAAKAAASVDPGAGTPAQGGDSLNRYLERAGANQRYLAQQTANAAEAQRQQTLAVGTHAQKVKILQDEYNRLSKIYGANSEQAINAETKVLQAQEAGAKAGAKAHKAAGAGRLADQTKLNNSLLADQERYQDQSEEADRQHGKRLNEIEAEYLKRSLEQQHANEVSKRQSRADFYDSLTSATKDVGPQIAQELSAAYEAAYAEAQKIAQAGNAKLAADYLALKQKQLQAELEYQKKLAEARTAKDKGEVERLEAIHKLQQQANDEEVQQLLAAGDANVNARNEALQQEAENYQEQQGKIGTAAENAAERKINASVRNQKVVDAETAAYREQEAVINRIGGGRTPNGAGTGLPAPPPVVPGATAVASGTPIDLGTVVSAINALGQLLNDVKGAIERDTSATTGAIRSLGSARLAGA